jgi:hypothetical protein
VCVIRVMDASGVAKDLGMKPIPYLWRWSQADM